MSKVPPLAQEMIMMDISHCVIHFSIIGPKKQQEHLNTNIEKLRKYPKDHPSLHTHPPSTSTTKHY